VGFLGKDGPFQGIAVRDLSSDQREHLQGVVNLLIEPYRQGDQDEARRLAQLVKLARESGFAPGRA